mmetsp:Transcript_14395/g.21246  ORF Transcript_14395/g.21246 Transcript_14395/m.21246 type:complete len:400 (+) Transcript_14395:177-1376(+)
MMHISEEIDQPNGEDLPTIIEDEHRRSNSKSLGQSNRTSLNENVMTLNQRKTRKWKNLEKSLNGKPSRHRFQSSMNNSLSLLNGSFQLGGSMRNIVQDFSRDIKSAETFFSLEDSQAISFDDDDDDDDDLLSELEDISSAQRELENEMDELERMFSLDSFGAVEEDIPSLSNVSDLNVSRHIDINSEVPLSDDDQNSTSSCNQSDSSEDHIMSNNASTDEKENSFDTSREIDQPRELIANMSTRQLKVQTSAREFASVHADPSVHTQNPQNCMQELNDHNEDIDCNEHESSAVINNIACGVYGRHEYTIKSFWPDREGRSVDFTRTYEGGLLVYLSTWIFLSFFFGRVPHDIFWMAALIIPLMVTTVEINLPHRMDEAVVALGILLCHFIFTRCVAIPA